jgi:hypothetical protein
MRAKDGHRGRHEKVFCSPASIIDLDTPRHSPHHPAAAAMNLVASGFSFDLN